MNAEKINPTFNQAAQGKSQSRPEIKDVEVQHPKTPHMALKPQNAPPGFHVTHESVPVQPQSHESKSPVEIKNEFNTKAMQQQAFDEMRASLTRRGPQNNIENSNKNNVELNQEIGDRDR